LPPPNTHARGSLPTSSVNQSNTPPLTFRQERLHQHLQRTAMTRLYFSKRGFTIIFAHENGSSAFIDTFGINTYDDSPLSSNSRDYINSFGTEVYLTFVDHFSSRGSSTTLAQTSTSATTTNMTTRLHQARLRNQS
jgi:hypothetical protein